MEKYILSVDCGTQSVRVAVFDENGNMPCYEKMEFEPYYSPKAGWAEVDPFLYWNKMCEGCEKISKSNPKIWSKLSGVVVTTLRDTNVCLDENGNPLRPVILWLDQRRAKCENKMNLKSRLAFLMIGMAQTVHYLRINSKAYWLKENEPEIWKKTHKYVFISGFFNYLLTGKFIDSVASQVGHMPFDYRKRKWLTPNQLNWEIFGVDEEKLPEIKEPGEILGHVTAEASRRTGIPEGIPVIAGGSDKGCETLGVGCLSPDTASISFGTTATIQSTTDKYMEAIRFLPAYPAVMPGHFNPEVQIYRGYWMISWFKNEFADKENAEAKEKGVPVETILDKHLEDIPPGSDGLLIQPYWSPLIKNPYAKGAMIGFGDVHTRLHIYRAIIEGINFALIEGMHKIQKKTNVEINRIMVSGGGASSDHVCQITSDMFGKTVYKSENSEACSLGAAMIGFVSLGIHSSYEKAVEKMVRIGKKFEPDRNNYKKYKSLYNRIYKRIYKKLKRIYMEISHFNTLSSFIHKL